MTATITEEVVEVDVDKPLPCEHPEHGRHPWHTGPGAYLIRSIPCQKCGDSRGLFIICKSGWDHAVDGLYCAECGSVYTREQAWQFITAL